MELRENNNLRKMFGYVTLETTEKNTNIILPSVVGYFKICVSRLIIPKKGAARSEHVDSSYTNTDYV